MRDATNLTARQQAWFATLTATLERDTGRSLEDWVALVHRDCSESTHHKRAQWLKAQYGLTQTRAHQILDAAYPPAVGWDEPAELRAALWKDDALLKGLETAIATIPGTTQTQRKGYTAWANSVTFAAAKPVKGGNLLLGLAIPPESDPRLNSAGKEGWSDRLHATVILTALTDIDAALIELLKTAHTRS